MKKLIFIDNDQERDVKEGEDYYLRRNLRDNFGLNWKDVEVIREFYFRVKEQGEEAQYEMLFNPENIIITYSMYTSSHYGSLHSFNHFLRVAGRNCVNGITYVNLSMEEYMMRALEYCRDEKYFVNILRAVAQNNFVSYCYDKQSLTKIVVDLSEGYNFFKSVPITLDQFNEMIGKV